MDLVVLLLFDYLDIKHLALLASAGRALRCELKAKLQDEKQRWVKVPTELNSKLYLVHPMSMWKDRTHISRAGLMGLSRTLKIDDRLRKARKSLAFERE